MAGIKLIAGLGNPGAEYEATRHNAGFWFIEQLAQATQINLQRESKFHGWAAQLHKDSHQAWIFKPNTYMNESGRAVKSIAQFYKINPSEILIAHDELDFPAGMIKLKAGGGHGGHNGLRDIIECLGSADFYRLRIGIGHPGHKDRVTPFVLSPPSSQDRELIFQSIDDGLKIIPDMLSGNFEKAHRELYS